jgi:Mn-dependent DtxR family transcriptional regulator
MYNMKIKMKFVQLKSMGLPMYKISNELGVHRTTLTMWHKELAPYILIAKQDAIDELLFENGNMKLQRVEMLSRRLTQFYHLLDLNDKDTEEDNTFRFLTYSDILDNICKLTKLLQMETNEKGIEKYLKGSQMKVNIKTKRTLSESEIENDPLYEEAPIWVTDADKFENHQPDDIEGESFGTNLENAAAIAENEGLGINTDLFAVEDINKKHPDVQEIFKRTIYRRYAIENADENADKDADKIDEACEANEDKKPVKNSSKKEAAKNKKKIE